MVKKWQLIIAHLKERETIRHSVGPKEKRESSDLLKPYCLDYCLEGQDRQCGLTNLFDFGELCGLTKSITEPTEIDEENDVPRIFLRRNLVRAAANYVPPQYWASSSRNCFTVSGRTDLGTLASERSNSEHEIKTSMLELE